MLVELVLVFLACAAVAWFLGARGFAGFSFGTAAYLTAFLLILTAITLFLG